MALGRKTRCQKIRILSKRDLFPGVLQRAGEPRWQSFFGDDLGEDGLKNNFRNVGGSQFLKDIDRDVGADYLLCQNH
jgi:hypothetical protein